MKNWCGVELGVAVKPFYQNKSVETTPREFCRHFNLGRYRIYSTGGSNCEKTGLALKKKPQAEWEPVGHHKISKLLKLPTAINSSRRMHVPEDAPFECP